MAHRLPFLATTVLLASLQQFGCARHQERPMITAVGLSPANRCDPPGIPYYLPKPLLVVAKNIRHIDESKVGLTGPVPIPGGFDNQAAYGDIKANVTVPATSATPASSGNTTVTNTMTGEMAPPSHSMVTAAMTPSGILDDGIEPDSFFTYQVIFVPDLTQKYGLQITGGAGEFRAAMNMVNGWMYTGMGPFYLKDSSSAQNAMSTGVAAMYAGRGAADVLNEIGGLTTAIGNLPKKQEGGGFESADDMARTFQAIAAAAEIAPRVPETMLNYAEVYIYEPVLTPDGSETEWRLVTEHHFNRDYFSSGDPEKTAAAKATIVTAMIDALQKKRDGSTSTKESQAELDARIKAALKEIKEKQESADFDSGAEPQGRAQSNLLDGDQDRTNTEQLRLPPAITPPVFDALQAPANAVPTNSIDINVGDGDNSQLQQRPIGLRELLHKPQTTIKNRTVSQFQTKLNQN